MFKRLKKFAFELTPPPVDAVVFSAAVAGFSDDEAWVFADEKLLPNFLTGDEAGWEVEEVAWVGVEELVEADEDDVVLLFDEDEEPKTLRFDEKPPGLKLEDLTEVTAGSDGGGVVGLSTLFPFDLLLLLIVGVTVTVVGVVVVPFAASRFNISFQISI